MRLQTKLLEDLMKKYEKSKHFRSPNQSNRRVFLSKEKGEMKGYCWESEVSKELFIEEALFLEKEQVILILWEKPQQVLSQVTLNLAQVEKAYGLLEKIPPWQEVEGAGAFLRDALGDLNLPWLLEWKERLLLEMEQTWKLPSFLQKGEAYGKNFCALLCAFDGFSTHLCHGMTLRSFSIKVFHHSKVLEQQYLPEFIKLLKEYHPEVSALWKDASLSEKEILQMVGITPRGEMFSLSGNLRLEFSKGTLEIAAVGGSGLALTGESCGELKKIHLDGVKELYFIENKTNYEDFVWRKEEHQAVIYHGGFFSPSKGKFFQKISDDLEKTEEVKVFFWGDIDLGGFRMFQRLQGIFPSLMPYKMGEEEVGTFAKFGLPRSVEYLEKLKEKQGEFPLFQGAIEEILKHEVTIEQEVLLMEEKIEGSNEEKYLYHKI